MTDKAISFEEFLARDRAIRKSGGTPPPLPPALEVAKTQLQADVLASVGAEDPDAMLRAAIHTAVAAVLKQAVLRGPAAVAPVTAAPRPAPRPAPTTKGTTMTTVTVEDFVQKGGDVWRQIETQAYARVAKTAGAMTARERAQAVDAFLRTAEGARLYDAYLAEQDAVVRAQTRARQDPPEGAR